MRLFLRALRNLVQHPGFVVAAGVPLILANLLVEWASWQEAGDFDRLGDLGPVFVILISVVVFAVVSILAAVGAYRTYLSPVPPPVPDALFADATVYRAYFPRTLTVTIVAAVPAISIFLLLQSDVPDFEAAPSGTIAGVWTYFVEQQLMIWVFTTLALMLGVSLPSIANGRRVGFRHSIKVGLREAPSVAVAVSLLSVPLCLAYYSMVLRGLDAAVIFDARLSGQVALIETAYALVEVSVLAELYRKVRHRLDEEDPDGAINADIFE